MVFLKPEKVLLAILDRDLKARTYAKFPLSSEGTKVDVVNAGKGYFMPKIDNDSFIEFPYRSPLTPWKISWRRVYVAVRGSASCINFRTEEVKGPDPQQVIDAARSELVKNFGKEKIETPLITYIILIAIILVALKVFGVIV